ncbi:MAG: DUF192 domain-containing protein [Phycisphaerales bacterium]|nr:DUF192 domain-containing protein [Phycisphaerales bacterium]
MSHSLSCFRVLYVFLGCVGLILSASGVGCERATIPLEDSEDSTSDDDLKPDRLDRMETDLVLVRGHAFEVWLARTPAQLQRGLMRVPAERMVPPPGVAGRGMLFIFPSERPLSFWMYNTIIPLDIAYIRGDGVIVSTYTMAPLETQPYPSGEPALYALEVPAGLFEKLDIKPGDKVEIPQSVLKSTP